MGQHLGILQVLYVLLCSIDFTRSQPVLHHHHFQTRAEQVIDVSGSRQTGFTVGGNMLSHFYSGSQNAFIDMNNSTGGMSGGKYELWSTVIAAQALVDAASADSGWLPKMAVGLDTLESYWNPVQKGYTATEYFNGDTDMYYDDNSQVAEAYLTAYEVSGNNTYLEYGKRCVDFLMTGWNDTTGGVVWHRNHPGANTVTTSEAGLAAARLANHLRNDTYTDFAKKCLDYLWSHTLDSSDGLFYDGPPSGGGGNLRKWTYNQGTPISLCTLLYKYTKDESYYQKSHDIMSQATNSSTVIFDTRPANTSRRFYSDYTKFYQLLVTSFADYLEVFGGRDSKLDQSIHFQANNTIYLMNEFLKINDGWYAGDMNPTKLDKSRADRYNQYVNTNEGQHLDSSEFENGSGNSNFRSQLIEMGSAARIFFQTARTLQ